MIGVTYGALTVVGEGGRQRKERAVRVRCSCGQERLVRLRNLQSGNTRSCGCRRREQARRQQLRHGHTAGGTDTPEYRLWQNIKHRCFDSAHAQYKDYGGRGITMAVTWRNDFPTFLADIGRKPDNKLTLDRTDNDRGYEPGNVRWATRVEQAANKRERRTV